MRAKVASYSIKRLNLDGTKITDVIEEVKN